VVTAILLTLLHRLMPWRRPSEDAGFAPVARRSAPDVDGAPTTDATPQRWLDRRTASGAWMLRFAGLTAALYLAGSAVLVITGSAHAMAPTWMWVLRSVVVAAVALVALRYASRWHRRAPDPSSRTQIIGFATLAAGAVAMVLMGVDMHVLGLYHIQDAGLHTSLHATAVLAMLVGAALTLAMRRSVAPAPAMVRSAR
jgi:hypothetical protein